MRNSLRSSSAFHQVPSSRKLEVSNSTKKSVNFIFKQLYNGQRHTLVSCNNAFLPFWFETYRNLRGISRFLFRGNSNIFFRKPSHTATPEDLKLVKRYLLSQETVTYSWFLWITKLVAASDLPEIQVYQ